MVCNLRAASELSLVVADGLDLGSGTALGVEAVLEPVDSQLLGELDADDALAHAEDLGVVGQDGALDGEGVVGCHGADAGNLVGGDGDAQAGSADEEAAVSLALLDELGALDGGVGVGGLVVGSVDADVGDGGDAGVLLEDGLDGILVRDTGLVAGHDDTEGLRSRHDDMDLGKLEEAFDVKIENKVRAVFFSNRKQADPRHCRSSLYLSGLLISPMQPAYPGGGARVDRTNPLDDAFSSRGPLDTNCK